MVVCTHTIDIGEEATVLEIFHVIGPDSTDAQTSEGLISVNVSCGDGYETGASPQR